MSENAHWIFVAAAYAVTGLGLCGLIAFVLLRLRRWEHAARAGEQKNA
jgi:hypothetical protein